MYTAAIFRENQCRPHSSVVTKAPEASFLIDLASITSVSFHEELLGTEVYEYTEFCVHDVA